MKIGDTVVDFEAPSAGGGMLRLSQLLGSGPVVLFFYPKAFTPGCTAQSCHFRDVRHELTELGATAVGISADTRETQQRFVDTYELGFPVLSDVDGRIAKQFKVKRALLPFNKRMTFVIDTDFRVLEVIASESDMHVHADRAMRVLSERP